MEKDGQKRKPRATSCYYRDSIQHQMELGFDESIDELCKVLESSLKKVGTGEFDGSDSCAGFVALYAYGPDAMTMFEVMKPLIQISGHSAGATAILRFGEGLLDPVSTLRISL